MPNKRGPVSRRKSRREIPVDHEIRIDPLLETAGITKNAITRADLEIAIRTAQSAYVSEQMLQDQPATKELFRPFEMSIAKTLMYLRRVKKHAAVKNIDFTMYPLGTGIVKALPIFQAGKYKEMPLILDGTTIGVDIESLLCDWQSKLKGAKRRERARPRRRDKDDIVLYAAQFFCRHSARKPSNDVKNPFPAFVEQFYEAVSGAPSSRSLNSQIGKVLKALRTAGIMGLFETPPPRTINSQQFTRVLKELSESGRHSGV